MIKKLIVPVIIIAILFVAYNMFFKKDTASTSLLKVQTVSSNDALGADIINAINQISTLKLDRAIFDDPVFNTLIDRSEKIDPENKHRPNPFAPIGNIANSTSTSTTTVKVN